MNLITLIGSVLLIVRVSLVNGGYHHQCPCSRARRASEPALFSFIASPFKGVLEQYPPYAYYQPQSGFMLNVITSIGLKLGYLSVPYYQLGPEQRASQYDNHLKQWVGPITELINKNADFMVGNFHVGPEFGEVADFTDPIMTDQYFAVLVSHRTAEHYRLCSIQDFIATAETAPDGDMILGVWDGFIYMYPIRYNRNRTAQRLRALFERTLIMESQQTALADIKNRTGVAYMSYSSVVDHLVSQDCDLVVLRDDERLMPRNVSIPMRKGSALLSEFNWAIGKLKQLNMISNFWLDYTMPRCSPKPMSWCDSLPDPFFA